MRLRGGQLLGGIDVQDVVPVRRRGTVSATTVLEDAANGARTHVPMKVRDDLIS